MQENKKYLVLIVDDNFENLQVLGNTLKSNNYSPAFAQSGQIAINFLKKRKPDLILLDIMMPEMDGFEVCKILKADENTKDIPIIFLTAKRDTDNIVQGLEYGAVDYVTKPFNVKELITRVSTHIELKTTKEKLIQKVGELDKANKIKDKFFSIISHDLSNVFGSFMNLVELWKYYKETTSEKELERKLLGLQNSAEKGYDLLVNLLDWSRSETGRIEFQPTNLNVKEIIEENCQLLGSNATDKNIQIFFNIPTYTTIYADVNMLNTIIRNLISNAIKFTPKGGEIRIISENNKNYSNITIKDNGVGIAKEDIPKLFKIDTKHKTLGTNEERGTGLGLILCKEFVNKHNGEIIVNSNPNEGSRFTIRFPNPSKI